MPIAIETASQPWRPVDLKGEGLIMVVLSFVLSFLSVLVVSLRIYVRTTIRFFGVDDWFMCIGTLCALLHNVAAIWGGISGLGTVDGLLTVPQGIEADKAVLIWEVTINLAFGFVKTSICCALMRLTVQRSYRIVLWVLLLLTWAMNIWEVAASVAAYDPSSEICVTGPTFSCHNFIEPPFVGVQFAVYVAVDAACTLMPVFLLWNLQMSTREKVSTGILLGLGSLATVASIVRLPLSLKFNYVNDRLYHRGQVIIWTVVEVNVGIIAGSMPAIRKLFRWISEDFSWIPKPRRNTERNNYSLGTIRQMMDRSGTTRLRTPNTEAMNGRDDHDPESCSARNPEDCHRELKDFTTGSNTDTDTTTIVLSRNETSESGRALTEDRSHGR